MYNRLCILKRPLVENLVGKTVNLDLPKLDSDSESLLSAFRQRAIYEHWTDFEIETVTREAKSYDYDYLIQVLITHCESDSSYFD